jgi:hypothetical protein
LPPHRAAPRRCSNRGPPLPCSAGGASRTATLRFQCTCALRAALHLPFAITPQSARLLAAPLHHPGAHAARPTDRTPRQAQGYTVALPSAHPHPRALDATPLVSIIVPRCGECRAVLALPFLGWRRTSLACHANVPGRCESGEQSLPCAARRRRIFQCFGVTLVRTARTPAVTPRRVHSTQLQAPGTIAGTVTAARVRHTPTSAAMGKRGCASTASTDHRAGQ